MNPLRCLIVDDERLARQVLRGMLAAHPDIEIVAEAPNITEAANAIRQHKPDVLFLDIQMAGGNGFMLLDAIAPELPFVVFITAYDSHALRAFDVNAVDYLLKPVEPERLAEAIQRLRQRAGAANSLEPIPAALPRLLDDDSVLLPLGNSGCFAPVRDILHITARGKHSVVQLRDGRKVIVRQTLSSWIARLPAHRFTPLDRGCLVHWTQIQHADFTSQGGRIAFGTTGSDLTLGRAAAQRLRTLLAEKPHSRG